MPATSCAAVYKPVLDDIEIQGAQIDRAEVDELLHDVMEGEALVRCARPGHQLRSAVQDPAIQLRQLGIRRRGRSRRVEVVQVAERKRQVLRILRYDSSSGVSRFFEKEVSAV